MTSNPNPEKQYVIPHSTLRAVLDYLSQRPYSEVFNLVQGIQLVKEYYEPEKSPTPKQQGASDESAN